jgi:hypothetical protein
MNYVNTEDEVVQRVLDCFQKELRGLRGGRISRMIMGDAPAEGYVRRLSELDAIGRITGSVLGVWRINHTEIVTLPISFTVPEPAGRSRMYYDRASFDFAVASDRRSVVVGWSVGPRFGRGFRYHVVTDESGRLSLKLAETLWKS